MQQQPAPVPPVDVAAIRTDYRQRSLRRAELESNPMQQFRIWFDQAVHAELSEVNAMSLATTGTDGLPNLRTILMKGFDADGITFYTNYTSDKAREMEADPGIALLFFWKELERQVKIRGRVVRTSREESEAYFFSRPYDSRIGAWASEQSREIPDRHWLGERIEKFTALYPETSAPDCVPLPDFWGGYRLIPDSVEFWQGQPGRTHDRFLYRRENGAWTLSRISP